MVFSRVANFDVLRSLANGSISGTYAKLGTSTGHKVRAFCVVNNTNGDLFMTITNGSTPASDGTADSIFIPASSFRLYDIAADRTNADNAPAFVVPMGSQFWIRQSSAPNTGSVYLEILYASGE